MPPLLAIAASALLLLAADNRAVLEVPYRSQLDGSPYATANCGPTSVVMALAYHGIEATPWDVRVAAMKAQDSWVDSEGGYSDSYGVFVQHLATVVEQYGLRTSGLWRTEGAFRVDGPREWTLDDLRREVRAGRPVIVQVHFRSLPGRAGSPFRGDHYVVVHGAVGDELVYSDPMDRDGGGPAQRIAPEALERAMAQASVPRAAFAVQPPRKAA